MPVNLSIKDVPDDIAQRLRERAKRNHRSLQGELMAIVEAAAPALPSYTSPVQVYEEARKLAETKGLSMANESADIVRAMRDGAG